MENKVIDTDIAHSMQAYMIAHCMDAHEHASQIELRASQGQIYDLGMKYRLCEFVAIILKARYCT